MKESTISINKHQYLSDIGFHFKSNTIFAKTVTGAGATTQEIKEDRDSIIVMPNAVAVTGKAKDEKHKDDNLMPVLRGVTSEDVAEYLQETRKQQKHIKIITTPESFPKVKRAFQMLGLIMHSMCFLLFDECHKAVEDCDYRTTITLPFDDFFLFQEKAMVSATPIVPPDPRFKSGEGFEVQVLKPEYDYAVDVAVWHTDNATEAIRSCIAEKENGEERVFVIFANTTMGIMHLIGKLGIKDESSVFCAEDSVRNLKDGGVENAYSDWSEARMRKYNFFTCRYYAAFDMILPYKPEVVFFSDAVNIPHTMLNPDTDVVQALGRMRNGFSSCTHIVVVNPELPLTDRPHVVKRIDAFREAYRIIKNQADMSDSEVKPAFREVADMVAKKAFIDGNEAIDYFLRENYIEDELLKSDYRDIKSLIRRYENNDHYRDVRVEEKTYGLIDAPLKKKLTDAKTEKETRMLLVSILDTIQEDHSEIAENYRKELREIDEFIVDAYETIGSKEIKRHRFSAKKIREAVILKKYREGVTSVAAISMINNSFAVGKKYRSKDIKQELNRIFNLLGIKYPGIVTGHTISNFFQVKDTKIKGDRAYLLLSSRM